MVIKEETKIRETKKFLESYSANKKLLGMMKYEKEYFSGDRCDDEATLIPCADEVLIKSKMFEVRRFIMNLEDGNEKLMLFYHYIRGLSVEKCAEMMDISRTSGFRLRRRAIERASRKRAARKFDCNE